jgi:hypothetical protein
VLRQSAFAKDDEYDKEDQRADILSDIDILESKMTPRLRAIVYDIEVSEATRLVYKIKNKGPRTEP